MSTHRVEFPGTGFPGIDLPERANLALHLSVLNSPLLFGCRSGLCGTCLIEVEPAGDHSVEPPGDEESETLAVCAPGNPRARLACQLVLTADLRLRRIQGA